MKSVEIGKVDRLDASNGSYRGIMLTAQLQHTANNTAFVGLPIAWEQVIVTCKIKKADGSEHVICQDPALPLILSSTYKNGVFNQASPVGSPVQVTYQAQTASLPHILKQTAYIDFGEVVNLVDGDSMTLEVNCLPSAVIATVNTSMSFIYFDLEDGIGNGYSLPAFRVDTLKGGENSLPLGVGHGVKTIHFVNNDKSGIVIGNQVLVSYSLRSDKVTRTETYEQILLRRYREFVAPADADSCHQTFCLLDMDGENQSPFKELIADNVSLQISLQGANVTAAKNWVVARKLVKNRQVAREGKARLAKHIQFNTAQAA